MSSFLKFEGKSTFASLETILFIREVIEVHPEHRATIFEKICQQLGEMRSHLVIRVALWIIGEYAISQEEVQKAFSAVKRNVGSLPIYPESGIDFEEQSTEKGEQEEAKEKAPKIITKTVILADGSYGTQTVVVTEDAAKLAAQGESEASYLPLRKALLQTEDDYLASCLAITLTKLAIKSKKNLSKSYQQNSIDAILIVCAMLKEHQNPKTLKGKKLDKDSMQRMQLCLKILTQLKGLKEVSAVQKVLVE